MDSVNSPADEDIEWGSTAALCPFCGKSFCSGGCLRSPKHESSHNYSDIASNEEILPTLSSSPSSSGAVPPYLALAVLDELLDDDDDEGDDTLLYVLSQTLDGANEVTADLEKTKRELEALMMHHLECARQPRVVSDGDSSAFPQPAEANDSDLLQEPGCSYQELMTCVAEGMNLATSQPVAGTTQAQLLSQNPALTMMRSRVSQLKRRYQKDGFNLDLTYITPRVIAMGCPAWGTEKYYRNPIDEVELFLESKHGGHYRIYNLCSERPEYDSPKRFQGRYKRFPFDDHNAPCPISVITDFVQDAVAFFADDIKNVVVVHCKAGKGRTGVMISCLMRSLDPEHIPDAETALRFFGEARTHDGRGVTIPSQRRYVHYYDRIVREFGGNPPPLRALRLYQITIDSEIKTSGQVEVYFIVEENGEEKIDSRRVFLGRPKKDPKGFLFLFQEEPKLQGDLRFIFYQRNRLVDTELFHFWLNTSLCSTYEQLSLKDRQLDGRPAKSKVKETLCEDLTVNVIFLEDSADGGKHEKINSEGCAEREAAVPPNVHTVSYFLPKGLQRFLPKLSPS